MVGHYEAATFTVEMYLPHQILPTTKMLTGLIQARYLHGRPLKGYVYLRLGIKWDQDIIVFATYGDNVQRGTKRNLLHLYNGLADFEFDLKELESLGEAFSFQALTGGRLFVEATVTDEATGEKVTAVNTSCVFGVSALVVNFDKSSKTFKPGLPYKLWIQVSHANGLPAKHVLLRVQYSQKKMYDWLNMSRPTAYKEIETTSTGRAYLIIETGDAASLQIKVTAKAERHSTEATMIVKAEQSAANQYLELYPSGWTYEVDEEILIKVHQRGTSEDIVWMAFRQEHLCIYGKISQKVANTHTNRGTIKFVPSADMLPRIRVLAYVPLKDTNTGQMHQVSASILLNIVPKCSTKISFEGHNQPFKPTTLHDMKITAAPESTILLHSLQNLPEEADYLSFNIQETELDVKMVDQKQNTKVLDMAKQTEISSRKKRNVGIKVKYPLTKMECCDLAKKDVTFKKFKQMTTVTACLHMVSLRLKNLVPNCSQVYFHCCLDTFGQSYRMESVISRKLESFPFNGQEQSTQKGAFDDKSYEYDYKYVMEDYYHDDEELNYSLKHISEQDDIEPGHANTFHWTFDHIDEADLLIHTRKYFPDSWLFKTLTVGKSGTSAMAVTVPDFITTWWLQALSLSASGICSSVPLPVIVKHDLFIKMTLPDDVVVRSHIDVKVTIYNFKDESLPVRIYFLPEMSLCTMVDRDVPHKARIEPYSSVTLTYFVVPMEPGEVSVTVKLYSVLAGDTVVKTMTVGQRKEKAKLPYFFLHTDIHSCPYELTTQTYINKPSDQRYVQGEEEKNSDINMDQGHRESLTETEEYTTSSSGDTEMWRKNNFETSNNIVEMLHTNEDDSENNETDDAGDIRLPKSSVVLTIYICVEYKEYIFFLGEMVLEVGLFAGFEVVQKDLLMASPSLVRRFEVHQRAVIIHLKQLAVSRQTCVRFRMRQKFAVSHVQPVVIKVFNKLNIARTMCRKIMYPPHLDLPPPLLWCQANTCLCTAHCSECHLFLSRIKAAEKACYQRAFVMFVMVTDFITKRGFEQFQCIVKDIIAGANSMNRSERLIKVHRLILLKSGQCTCPDIKPGHSYLIIGPFSNLVQSEDLQFRILINSNIVVQPYSKKQSTRLDRLVKFVCPGRVN